jgi:hypothetical protein
MKTLPIVWALKATGLLFLVNLFAAPLNLRAQDDGRVRSENLHMPSPFTLRTGSN